MSIVIMKPLLVLQVILKLQEKAFLRSSIEILMKV